MSLKKLLYSAFIAFWACVLTIVILNALSQAPPSSQTSNSHNPGQYTLEQVAEHDSLDDCWMAIEGNVYDFTDYIDDHPTDPSILAPWCGREATQGMRTKGKGRNHSPRAWQAMEDYRIGRLRTP